MDSQYHRSYRRSLSLPHFHHAFSIKNLFVLCSRLCSMHGLSCGRRSWNRLRHLKVKSADATGEPTSQIYDAFGYAPNFQVLDEEMPQPMVIPLISWIHLTHLLFPVQDLDLLRQAKRIKSLEINDMGTISLPHLTSMTLRRNSATMVFSTLLDFLFSRVRLWIPWDGLGGLPPLV
ncbi:uncharacterized protein BT62DRAFT_463792 [Guyanagaster necrorhizus]|uniref:Uncharacterized protein n=1 Tax=Guyanagaster necrorhizus TaxID=856835 RepID=A0A9P8APE7_9AGAR|nr:uncharacterized protein BT62DRAFT_463792 [Guyanagaster necrorhizus MCA 3950]KAG7441787.1 hypothetical protein BT62DRAFT_463792 [Guyanagaster necrorhizus MCA 3950]